MIRKLFRSLCYEFVSSCAKKKSQFRRPTWPHHIDRRTHIMCRKPSTEDASHFSIFEAYKCVVIFHASAYPFSQPRRGEQSNSNQGRSHGMSVYVRGWRRVIWKRVCCFFALSLLYVLFAIGLCPEKATILFFVRLSALSRGVLGNIVWTM